MHAQFNGGRRAFFVLFALLGAVCGPISLAAHAADDKTADEKKRLTITAVVVDAETGKPIPKFMSVAGTSWLEGLGWQWQGHTAHEFRDGQMDWPPPGKAGYDEQVVRIEADGYIPHLTKIIEHKNRNPHNAIKPISERLHLDESQIIRVRPGEPVTMEIRMQPDPGVVGRVITPDGKPAAGAELAIGMANDEIVRVNGGKINFSKRLQGRIWPRAYRRTMADENGNFSLPAETQNAVVVVVHSHGVKISSYDEFLKSTDVHLEPWGRIDGQVLWGKTPGSGEKVSLIAHGCKPTRDFQPTFMLAVYQNVVSDENGKFAFEMVPPGLAQLSCGRLHQHADVLAGKATPINIGGRGRPVVGKLIGRVSWEGVRIRIAPNAPRPGDMGTQYDPWPAYYAFLSSPAGKNYVKNDIDVDVDGTFRIDDVPPEYYQLFVDEVDADGNKKMIGGSSFHVKTIDGGQTDEALEIGQIEIRSRP